MQIDAPRPSKLVEVLRTPFLRDVVLALCGLGTSILTAVALAYAELSWGVAIYSMMVWLLLPMGALMAGIAGATGYYGGARLLGARPGPAAMASLVVVSTFTFALVHYVEYRSLTVDDGTLVSNVMPFSAFLDRSIRATSMELTVHHRKMGRTEPLGDLGYVVAALQVLGFAAGGLVVFGWLRSDPYCGRCSLYLVRSLLATRTTDDVRVFRAANDAVRDQMDSKRLDAAVNAHAAMSGGASTRQDYRLSLEVRSCPTCPVRWVRLSAQEPVQGEVQVLTVSAFMIAGSERAA